MKICCVLMKKISTYKGLRIETDVRNGLMLTQKLSFGYEILFRESLERTKRDINKKWKILHKMIVGSGLVVIRENLQGLTIDFVQLTLVELDGLSRLRSWVDHFSLLWFPNTDKQLRLATEQQDVLPRYANCFHSRSDYPLHFCETYDQMITYIRIRYT